MAARTRSTGTRRSRRAPSPFVPFYCPRWWRRRASLDGRHLVDLARAWQRLSWSAITRIAIEHRNGTLTFPFREAADHRMLPYPKEGGPGTLTRRELRELHEMTDSALERRVRDVLGVCVRLTGRDSPKRKCLRWQAVECLATCGVRARINPGG